MQEDTLLENYYIGIDRSDLDHPYQSLRTSIFSTDFGNYEYVGFAGHYFDFDDGQTSLNVPECFWPTKGLKFEIVDGLAIIPIYK